MKDGFIRICSATPRIKVADIDFNTNEIISIINEAYNKSCSLVVFPELSLSGATCNNLFFQDAFITKAEEALKTIVSATSKLNIISLIGLPIRSNNRLYNCVAVVSNGEIRGYYAKKNATNKYFSSWEENTDFNFKTIGDFVYQSYDDNSLSFKIGIGDEVFSPSFDTMGANIIFSVSSSNEIIGRASYRRDFAKVVSGSHNCIFVHSNSGFGESTQDYVFSGHKIIAENGNIISESMPYDDSKLLIADVDLNLIQDEKAKNNNKNSIYKNSFGHTSVIPFVPNDIIVNRVFPKLPFVPQEEKELSQRCREILIMQQTALATRLSAINAKEVVLGLSGGLDSTLALIACCYAFKRLGIDLKGIHAISMPCFGTTTRTYNNSKSLAEAYGVSYQEINIREAVTVHLKDLNHDLNDHSVTYENAQARERTQVVMDLANKIGGLVIGTGDLSELALGFATYNGDHMSMYGINASIPKTLIRYIIRHEALMNSDNKKLYDVLIDILNTPVSPELLPPSKEDSIVQKTEDIVGPYELHDFFLYYFIRYGFAPSKIYRMALLSFDGIYDARTIYKWEEKFIRRFFMSAFKRSCLPDGPKVGSVSLSPRGDYEMPSDASLNVWLEDLKTVL